MTTMGKILVTINLLFSLATGSLIIMVFMTRTHWARGYAELTRDLERERTELNKEIQLKFNIERRQTEENERLKKDYAEAVAAKDQALEVAKDARDKMNEAKVRETEANLNAQKATAVAEAMKVEIKSLDAQLREERERVRELGLQNKDYKAEAIKARTDLQSALDRNEQLLKKHIETERKLAVALGEQAQKAGRDIPNPPPDDIYGRVTGVDESTGWVTINLGSDSGLSKGNTLEIYRLRPRPTYVGTLRVYDVRPNEAIGKLMGAGPRGRVQKDDDVASRILGGP
jgi:hypothetical protein